MAHNYTLTLTMSGGAVRSSVENKPNEEGTLEVRVAPPGVTVPISSLGLTASRVTQGAAELEPADRTRGLGDHPLRIPICSRR